ncbi:MAG: 2-polyprenyl-6-hydroxyphenyl methylase/3-demethylubiquinone-9 3-methyltransferase [Candidatus Pseudothioglobus sp.]|jgi:2-polyprenyl-6-hydroxyphenyl methylase/3-demethylubiquinone-9 3-methyltransferase
MKSMTASTVRPEEIKKFNQLAETWWDTTGPMWPLHRLNALRVPFILAQVQQHLHLAAEDTLQNVSVLDVGCGGGILAESMARLGASVYGIDMAERNIYTARQHSQGTDLDLSYAVMEIQQLPAEQQFDVVLNMEVVEHVDDLVGFMASCGRATKPGGMMIVATINRTLYSLVTAKIAAEYVLRWLPRGTHDWRRFVTPVEAMKFLKDMGFGLGELTGVGVNPLKRNMHLTSFLGGNYMLVAMKPAEVTHVRGNA